MRVEPLEGRLCLSATFSVTNSNDDLSAGSLRFAIDAANQSGDPSAIVEFTSGVTSPIDLTLGKLEILADMSIVNNSGNAVEIHQTGAASRVFEVGADALNVAIGSSGTDTITITGGTALGANGGGIYVEGDTSQLTLTNVAIVDNRAIAVKKNGGNGGGIYSYGAVNLIDSFVGTTDDPNLASIQGGGIWAEDGVSLDSSHVDGNQTALKAVYKSTGGGGGIFVGYGGVTLANGSSVSNNFALHGEGGGISVLAGYVEMSGSSAVDSNTAQDVGGIAIFAIDTSLNTTAVSVADGSSVSFNASTAGQRQSPRNFGGGGISVITGGDVTIDASQVNHNSTVGMYSAGIVVGLGSITVTNGSQINGNRNNGPGGGLAANFGGTVTVSGQSQVNGNTGAALGGGIINFAGPLTDGIVITDGSQVNGNTLTNGETIARVVAVALADAISAIKSNSKLAASVGGTAQQIALEGFAELAGAARQYDSQLHQAVERLSHPLGKVIGGGGVAGLVSGATITDGSQVNDNVVGVNVLSKRHKIIGLGGGIFSLVNGNGGITVDASEVNNNQAISGEGGGIYLPRGTGLITNGSTINGNSSSRNGGGIFNAGTLTVEQSTIANNIAARKGGGIYNAGQLTQDNATIIDNSPDDVFTK